MRTFGYPKEKIEKHVFDIQIKKGLKKKDLFFEKVGAKNSSLLDIDSQMEAPRKLKEIFKKMDDQIKEIEEEAKRAK
jgi:hypothetical protein